MTIPKLRFQEFDGDWNNYELGNISDIKTGPFGSTLHQEDYVEIGTPIITVEHLGEIGLTSQNLPLVSDQDKIRLKAYSLKKGDIAFSRVGSVDRCAIITDKESGWLFSGRILRVRPNQKIINSKNLMYALKTEDAKYRIRSVAVGQTMPSLNTEILKNFSICLSYSKEEQTKIASFLSAVDEKIRQLMQKHQLLNQYKQGMTQKLFSQQIRFKADDGSEFGEWEDKSLLELSEKAMYGMNASATEYDGENKYLRITDICESSHKFKTDSLTSPNAELEEKYKLNLGDLLFARTGASVGKSYLYNPNDGITYFAGFLIKFSLKQDKVNPYFIFVQTLTQDFDKWVATNSVRSGQPGINAEEYSSYIFKIPCLEEQTKIANFLSAIDQKIDVVTQQIEQAKLWKKGLLQQMFV